MLAAVESVHVYLNSSGSSNAEVAEHLAECAIEIPGKTHVYAAVLGLLNYEAKHVVEDTLSCVAARLRHELGAGDEVAIKMILRLLAALVPTSVLAPEAVLGLLSCVVENGARGALRAAGRPALQV